MEQKMMKSKQGFTLVELLIVIAILIFIVTGLIQMFIYGSVLADLASNKTMAVTDASNKLEEIRNYDFDDIVVDYASGGTPGDTFDLAQLTGKGKIYIDSTNPELLTVMVVVAWENKYSRKSGEDLDFDGVLDAGEDVDGDGELSSPVELVTMVTER
jgi:type II secretory pathway pseudopilin PulG